MPTSDFNGDGRDDILWMNLQTGVVMSWLGQPGGGFLYNEEAGNDPWAIGNLIAVGDFGGDGRSDTLWRTTDGQVYLSETYSGGAFYFHWSLGYVKNMALAWQVAATGDFDGDGRDDILWRQDGGALLTWSGLQEYVFKTTAIGPEHPIPTDWKVIGSGDFNGDGRTDILWRHDGGTITNWLSQESGQFLNNHGNTGQVIPTNWHVIGTGDFNGDGIDDILWRHESGTVTNWLGQANGGFVNNHDNTGQQIPTDWQVIATGDYNGDGKDDLLWRNDAGLVTNWLGQANGGFVNNHDNTGYAIDHVWQNGLYDGGAGVGLWDH